jgi:murein DD-endopeptidase MepM/ murein hydrolase activator NlpD
LGSQQAKEAYLMTDRRSVLLSGAAAALVGCGQSPSRSRGMEADTRQRRPETISISVPSETTQGGTLRGAASPESDISLGSAVTIADSRGRFVVGFDRDASPIASVRIRTPSGETTEHAVIVSARAYDAQTISAATARALGDDLFPLDWFDPEGDATAGDVDLVSPNQSTRSLSVADSHRIQRDSELKAQAFASRDAAVAGFADTWIAPVRGIRVSSQWGASRTVTTPEGRIRRIHYGVDIAALTNREIVTPAAARVVLAEADMYYEGGCVFLDHGQGLISVYLHMNSIDVAVGDVISGGQRIGAVGATGRATGPHLCWRMKWRDAHLDPTLMLPSGTNMLVGG